MSSHAQIEPKIVVMQSKIKHQTSAKYACFLLNETEGTFQLIAAQDVVDGDTVIDFYHTPPKVLSEGYIPLTVTGMIHYYEKLQIIESMPPNTTVKDNRPVDYCELHISYFSLFEFFGNRYDLSEYPSRFDRETGRCKRQAYYTSEQLKESFQYYEVDTENHLLLTLAKQYVNVNRHIADTLPEADFDKFKATIGGWLAWNSME
jgi:hypothetical protein